MRGLAVLWAVFGTALVLCASAWAKMSQTITLQEPTDAVAGASFNEPGESSAGLEVTLTHEGPCLLSYYSKEVTGSKAIWTVMLTGGGTCTITAKQAGNDEYEATEARLSFAVSGPTAEPHKRNGSKRNRSTGYARARGVAPPA